MLAYIVWDVSPEIFSIGGLSVRWYGLMWALGFLIGYEIMKRIFRHEHKPDEWVDKLFIYMLVGTIIGARIGHCFFYDWEYYSKHLLEVLYVWQGGLSSHGGAFGIIIAMWLYSRKVTGESIVWILDRIVIAVALCGAFIRFGNLMNSEIYGTPTTLPWGFIFVRGNEYPGVPCHPTQIYEMLYCLITFAILMWMYWKKSSYKKQGLLFGVFLIGVFLSRFLLEFIKNNQETFEEGMLFNMGQLLSVPFIIAGVYFIFFYKGKSTDSSGTAKPEKKTKK